MKENKEEKNLEDKIETIGKGSIIQHGKLNNRIYLIKLAEGDFPGILDELRRIAADHAYTKIFCKVPEWAAPVFFADGFLTEAIVPGFYLGRDAAFFLAKYLDSDRLMQLENQSLRELSDLLKSAQLMETLPENDSVQIKHLGVADAEQITELYRRVFQSYPFPIFNPEYILRTMQEFVRYFGVIKNGKLIAVASAEIDQEGMNAEMTDFATDPDFRGQKLGQLLLARMEEEMNAMGIKTLYTIARVPSIPMNKVFLKHQFQYAGTLLRNTNISGSIESMNVYYKQL
jgi:putative beta-lysine N-acetyltransferase